MRFLRQLLLCVAVTLAALYLWITYVPSSHAVLKNYGIDELLGIELGGAAETDAGRGYGFGGGPTRVIAAPVAERALADQIRAIGDGQALRAVTIRAQTVGLVTEIPVQAGARVEEGATIARLEHEAETIALERAEIVLANARDELERYRQLQGNVTEVRLREAELALRTAELEKRQAEFDLAQRKITAPISGWLGIIDIEVGDRVLAQDELATITDRTALLINFRVPERVITQLELGMPLTVVPLGLRNTELTGHISAIDTIVDRASRTLRVQARVANEDDRMRVGMAFEVELELPGDTLLSIEPLALQWSSQGAFVWAVRDGKAARVPVTIRQRNADSVLVDGDLQPGEPIVVEGVQNLRPGSEVDVVNPPEEDAARASLSPARL
jgi:RND family efflux transporter MFP subunit